MTEIDLDALGLLLDYKDSEIASKNAEIARLREALQYYADLGLPMARATLAGEEGK